MSLSNPQEVKPGKMLAWKVNGLNPSTALLLPMGSFLPEDDPLIFPDQPNERVNWEGKAKERKRKEIVLYIIKFVLLLVLLYLFICSLDFLATAFRLLGGKAIGDIFNNSDLLHNPLAGLMIGILVTVIVQSSSTSTSIVVTMVSAEIIDVPTAIPIIMGANIGTSVTSTVVSLFQSKDCDEFSLAFAAACVHDMFNWMTVIVFLPLEIASGYLYRLTDAIVNSMNLTPRPGSNLELLTVVTRPFTNLVIQLNKEIIERIAVGEETYRNRSLIKTWCNVVSGNATRRPMKCTSLFSHLELSDAATGGILLAVSLIILCTCLILMVKILNSIMRGRVASAIKTATNANFPGKLSYFTGYLYILCGCGITILVQSSSVFTSTLVPLAGLGVLSIERIFPLTIGSNIGTTTTSILASLAASGTRLRSAIQIALCHLFFNLSGIVLFYPVPFMRIPIPLAKMMGETTAKYRWFSIVYLLVAFLIVPGTVFGLSIAGNTVLMVVAIPLIILLLITIVINVLQHKKPFILPRILQTWDWLPLWMHSLKPYDRIMTAACQHFSVSCIVEKPNVSTVASEENLGNFYIGDGSTDNVEVVLKQMATSKSELDS